MRRIRRLNAPGTLLEPRPAESAGPPRPPWESPDLFVLRPADSEYGYAAQRTRHPATREELLDRCRADSPHVDLVWTPEFPQMLPPAEVPWLLGAVRERTGRSLRYNLKNGLALTLIWTALAAMQSRKYPLPLLGVLVLMLGVVPAIQPLWGLWRLRRAPDEYVRELASTFRYQVWLGTRRMVATWLIVACLLVVALAQVTLVAMAMRRGTRGPMPLDALLIQAASHMGDTAPLTGLDKQAVRAGQPWRLLTCELMHGHPLHLLFNVMALMAVGRLLEVHGHPVYVPTVFLFSALCASVFSLYFSTSTSVGASGGIMGLIGFLAVIGLRRRHVVPRGFLRSIAMSIALTAATGLVAYHFIDNAAHAGGLVGGVMLGVVYVRRHAGAPADSAPVHLAPSRLAWFAGWLSTAAITAATVATAWLLFSVLSRVD